MERRTFGVIFFFLLIVIASQDGVIKQAEARDCESQSHGYKGTCLRDSNCCIVCRQEGFSGGKCVGFRKRCFCTRKC
ncbi:defensin Ec-AMP-D1-like [Impatiens glandulifera]|uniref:defensin Ec-AMP-D1-like n=1 Tax=Impatiens glandulifera TaxID=253017 RepID=UPI001FB193CE|nr:defensin Ec-AMP-D1-like [Impatiens glandulifera]